MSTQQEPNQTKQDQIDQLERQQLITSHKITRLQETYEATRVQIESLRAALAGQQASTQAAS